MPYNLTSPSSPARLSSMVFTEQLGRFTGRLESFTEPLERIYLQRVLGIRKEFPELRPVPPTLLGIGVLLHLMKHHSVVEGYPLPREGAGIMAGNHFLQSDSYEAALAGWKSGRLIHPVVKKSLVEKGAFESDEYLASIGDKGDPAEYDPINAFVMTGIGAIPILRDNPGIAYIRACRKILDSDQLLGMFLQPSRDEKGFLRNLMPGVAYLASMKPYRDTPICLFAFSEEKAIGLKHITYNQLSNKLGKELSVAELTIIFADRIAQALPRRAQNNWKQVRKNEFRGLAA